MYIHLMITSHAGNYYMRKNISKSENMLICLWFKMFTDEMLYIAMT